MRLNGRFDPVQTFNDGYAFLLLAVAGDTFKMYHRKDDLPAIVDGKFEHGKVKMTEAVIRAGENAATAWTIDQVPAQYRPAIASILEKVK